MKTIGVVGCRRRNDRKDYFLVKVAVMKIYERGDRFVSGGCPEGADRFCEGIAKDLGATITIHYPAWQHFGKGAGFARNALIAEDADVLVACVASDRTGGTEDTIRRFRRMHPSRDVVLV